jgi:hypothetical protein
VSTSMATSTLAIAELDSYWFYNPGVEVAGLEMRYTELTLEDEDAADFLAELDEMRNSGNNGSRFGHTSSAAARALLESNGRCTSCRSNFDLIRAGAGDDITVHTADAEDGSDWPGALCPACEAAMRDGGFQSFVDFQFAQHPQCPECGERRARTRQYGMPARFDVPPWFALAGCVLGNEQWTCDECWHEW